MVCGLGTVHAAARVNHFGFQNNDADAVIGNSPNTLWHSYSQSNPRSRDEGINLAFRFDELEAGASVSFSFAYVLSEAGKKKIKQRKSNVFVFCDGFLLKYKKRESKRIILFSLTTLFFFVFLFLFLLLPNCIIRFRSSNGID